MGHLQVATVQGTTILLGHWKAGSQKHSGLPETSVLVTGSNTCMLTLAWPKHALHLTRGAC